MRVPFFVEDWCNKYKLCKGCKFQCCAPVENTLFDRWIVEMVEKIRAETLNEGAK